MRFPHLHRIFCLLFILSVPSLATTVVDFKEYCASSYADLALPAGTCLMQGYLDAPRYTNSTSQSMQFALRDAQGDTLYSTWNAATLVLRYYASASQGGSALGALITSTFTLAAQGEGQSRKVQAIYRADSQNTSSLLLVGIRLVR